MLATQAVVLNEGEIGHRSQSLARGREGVFHQPRDEPESKEGVTGAGPWPVGDGWDPLGGAEASLA